MHPTELLISKGMCKDIVIGKICDLFGYYRLENDGTIFISPYQVVVSYNMLLFWDKKRKC